MKDSTTNTAAPWVCVGCGKEAVGKVKTCDCPSGLIYHRGDLKSAELALTQQQGGEQEAGAIEADRDLAVEYITREMEAWTGSEEIRAARDAVNRLADLALRSKQAAPSEGDASKALQWVHGLGVFAEGCIYSQFSPPQEIHDTIVNVLKAANTSKQAARDTSKAGEAVASLARAQAAARPIGYVHSSTLWLGLGVFIEFFDGKDMKDFAESYLYTTPPRHPADEGMAVTDEVVARACVAYDTAAVGEGFMSSLDGDEHTRWMTAALTAALQAGTP